MKIAIYGDSFGILRTKWTNSAQVFEYEKYGLSWPELLAEQHDVTNFSLSGSAFMYSYEKFRENNASFDMNIFIVTDPNRVYVKALDGLLVFGTYWVREEMKRIKKLPWYDKKDLHLEILQSVDVYLDRWIDWDMMKHTQQVLVSNLWNINPNTIVVPAFPDSIQETSKNLFDLAKYELKLVDEKKHAAFDFLWLDCQRKCHFSEENNKVIFNKIQLAIQNKDRVFTLDKEELATPSKEFEFYVHNNKPSWAKTLP